MRLEKLESLRGFAAVYVVLHHMLPHQLSLAGLPVGYLFRFGQEAVILFFLLSGFVIHYSKSRRPNQTFAEYFSKRFLRIYLPLVVVLCLGYMVQSYRNGEAADPQWRSLAFNIFMLQDLGSLKPNVIAEPYMGNLPLWSLSYEWWFYMLYFPLQKYVASDQRRNALVFALSALASIVYVIWPTFVPRVLMYLSIWWTGVVMAQAYLASERVQWKDVGLAFTGLTFVAAINAIYCYVALTQGELKSIGVHPVLEFRHHAFAMAVVVGALLWQRMHWVGFDRFFKPFLPLASFSYAIYISHTYFVGAHYLSFVHNIWVESAGYLVASLAFAFFLERVLCPWLKAGLLRIGTAFKPRPAV